MNSEELNRKIAEALEPSPGFDTIDGRSRGGLWHRQAPLGGAALMDARPLDTDWDAMGALLVAMSAKYEIAINHRGGRWHVWFGPAAAGDPSLPRAVRDAVGRALGLGEVTG